MPKINLTNKTKEEQKRIIQNYMIRRSKHNDQGEVTVAQLVKKFKHKSFYTDKDKASHFKKLLFEIKRSAQADKD